MRSPRNASTVMIAVVAALIYFLVRILAIDRFVTTDEPLWLGRSANFLTALLNGDPAGTYQFAHPGVMTMWSGALAILLAVPDYGSEFSSPIRYVFDIHIRLRDIGANPLDVMVSARTANILLQSIVFCIAVGFLVRRYGRTVAILAGGLIALDPFVSAIDSVLHVDGLAAIFLLAAILALPVRPGLSWRTGAAWALAGTLAGMAVLTRWMSIAVLLPVGLTLAFQAWEAMKRHSRLRALGLTTAGGGLFMGAMVLTCVLLWPALRHDPGMVFAHMWDFSFNAATSGHEHPTFFRGVIHEESAGPLFYPVAILWRSTSIVLAGLLLFVVFIAGSRLRIVSHPTTGIMLALMITMTIVMSIADKKFDRYLVSVNLVVMVLAALGIAHTVRFLARRFQEVESHGTLRSRLVTVMLVALMLGGQLVANVESLPYRFAYFNPLFGGTVAAETMLQLGWGEGMDQAATIIQEDHWPLDESTRATEAPPATIRTTVNREQILYFLPPTYIVYPTSKPAETIDDWEETDYFVMSIQRWQRNMDPDLTPYLEQFEPLDSVYINGVEYFRVYKLDDIPPPPWLADE